jgi:hypothetical protein
VPTARIDTMAFGLGSGIAGLAGWRCRRSAMSGRTWASSYIVNCFMVVVLGGVGQLAGTVLAAMGLGVVSKFLEGWHRRRDRRRSSCWCSLSCSSSETARAVRDDRPLGGGISMIDRRNPPGLFNRLYGRHRLEPVLRRTGRHLRAGANPQPGVPEGSASTCRILGGADRQDHVLRDPGAGDGPGLGLHRHPLASATASSSRSAAMRIGMYLMRQIGHDGQYQSDLPDFMVFLDWKAYPW